MNKLYEVVDVKKELPEDGQKVIATNKYGAIIELTYSPDKKDLWLELVTSYYRPYPAEQLREILEDAFKAGRNYDRYDNRPSCTEYIDKVIDELSNQ